MRIDRTYIWQIANVWWLLTFLCLSWRGWWRVVSLAWILWNHLVSSLTYSNLSQIGLSWHMLSLVVGHHLRLPGSIGLTMAICPILVLVYLIEWDGQMSSSPEQDPRGVSVVVSLQSSKWWPNEALTFLAHDSFRFILAYMVVSQLSKVSISDRNTSNVSPLRAKIRVLTGADLIVDRDWLLIEG